MMADNRRARHILSWAQGLDRGGVERVLLRLAGGWTAAGRRVTLVLGEDGVTSASLPAGVETVVLGSSRYRDLVQAVPGIVRRLRPDLIFCPGNHYTAVAAWTRLRLGAGCPPIVAKLSNALDRDDMAAPVRAGYRAWLRLHPAFCDRLVAMSAASAAEAARTIPMPRDRIAVIANPPPISSADAAPPVLPASRYLLGVGRLEPQKRWDRAIAALAALSDTAIPLVILGEGSARAALTAQAAALGVGDRVIFAGHVADPLPAMRGAALLLLTSDYEGVPGVLREALSAGTPVVTTDSSVAIPEIVTSTDLGTIVARDDPAALVSAIEHWLAPDRARPVPVIASGDPVGDYLAVFDALVSSSA